MGDDLGVEVAADLRPLDQAEVGAPAASTAPRAQSATSAPAGDEDRFVVRVFDDILVVRADGAVFGHEIGNRTMSEAFPYGGSRVAFNGADDRFVVARYGQIIVVRTDGAVFGHDVDTRNKMISEPYAFSGSRVAFNGAVDRFVVVNGSDIIVVRDDDQLFVHEVADDIEVLPAKHLPVHLV